MKDPVVAEVTIAAPTTEVWRALREPRLIRRWHGWDHDGLEAEIVAIYLDDVGVAEDALTFDTGAGRFELESHGATTVVRVRRAAPAGAVTWHGVYDEINEGWLSFLQQLRYSLERHPDRDRRTLLLRRRVEIPDGERWFASRHQEGVELDEWTLVVATPDKTIVSSYDPDGAAALDRIAARFVDPPD